MERITNKIIAFLILNLILSVMIQAQETGQVTYNGISFTIPDQWKGVTQNNMYLMVSDTEAGLIALVPAQFNNLEGLKNELNRQQTDGSSIWLDRSEAIEDLGINALGAEFEGTFNYEKAKMYVSGKITGNNQGIMLFAGTSTEMYSDRYKELTIEILESMKVKPDSATKSNPGKISNEWETYYGNTRLTYMDSYYSSGYGDGAISGGYSNKVVIDLCTRGYFSYRNDFNLSGGSEYSSFGSNDGRQGSGTWSIEPVNQTEAKLILSFYNGQVQEFSMKYDAGGKTFLNGDRFYRTTMNDGTEYQPMCN